MTAKAKAKLIVVGVLRGAHGVRGEVRVESFTDNPDALFAYGPLLGADGQVVLTPVSRRLAKDHFIVRPKEDRQKEAWDALRGTRLHVPRSRLPKPADDEFYLEDLVGLAVLDPAGLQLGHVKAVQNFGAGDLVEIALAKEPGTLLVPFTREEFPKVDLAAGAVTLADLEAWRSDAGEA